MEMDELWKGNGQTVTGLVSRARAFLRPDNFYVVRLRQEEPAAAEEDRVEVVR